MTNNYKTKLVIPSHIRSKKVKIIGEKAFYYSGNVFSINIPDTVEIIEDEAFYGAQLFHVVIPNSVIKIGARAFYNTQLENVIISEYVDFIGEEAFNNWILLIAVKHEIMPPNWVENWNTKGKVYYNSNQIIHIDGVDYVLHNDKTSTVSRMIMSSRKINILDRINYNDKDYIVTTIDKNATFFNQIITEINIPDTIIKIKERAFENCTNLTNILIPNSVLEMGKDVFKGCTNIKITVEHNAKPIDWHNEWNPDDKEVIWKVIN